MKSDPSLPNIFIVCLMMVLGVLLTHLMLEEEPKQEKPDHIVTDRCELSRSFFKCMREFNDKNQCSWYADRMSWRNSKDVKPKCVSPS